jgi:SNF2 family DNA or RNA helicase
MEFIVTITEHHSLGYLILPYLAEKTDDKPYISVVRRLRAHDLGNEENRFTPLQSRLIKLTEKYSDEVLSKKFNKKGTLNDFYKNIKKEDFTQKIIPYIEEVLLQCLELLKGSGLAVYFKKPRYINLYEEDLVELCYEDIDTVFNFHRLENETHYFLTIRHGDRQLSLLHKNINLLVNEPCRILYQNKLYYFDKISGSKLIPFFEKEYVVIPRKVEHKYYETFVLNSLRSQQVNYSGFEVININPVHEAILSLEIDITGSPVFILKFSYQGHPVSANDDGKKVVHLVKKDDQYIFHCYERDSQWESCITERLEQAGIEFDIKSSNTTAGRLQRNLQADDPLNDQAGSDPAEAFYEAVSWISGHKNELEEIKIKISQENLDQIYYTGHPELNLKISQSNDWFDVHAIVSFGEFNIPFVRFRKNILNSIREYKLPNGEIAILPKEWFTKYRDLFTFGKTEEAILRLRNHHFTVISALSAEPDPQVRDKILALNNQKMEPQVLPGDLRANLRQYQKDGFDWLYYLYSNSLGGCLADDMGLGKTLQALTLLLKLKPSENSSPYFQPQHNGQLSLFASEDESETAHPASLIVLPVSLVHNWEKEIGKFAPSLRAFIYKGIKRDKNLGEILYNYDLILTTYGTVRNDAEILSQYRFFYLILDESQTIKNAESKTYQTITGLQSEHRLVLTGTPIENSLSDLWSQMNFLNRGLLGGLNFFKHNFITPIEHDKDPEKTAKLHSLIRPFILRRTKEQVARDLPPLTEESFTVEMTKEQNEVYEAEKSSVRNLLLTKLEGENSGKNSFYVLQALMRLRQIAIHPKLINPDSGVESGKFNEILTMLNILVNENHKILVFSSFVKHLNLLEKEFLNEKWAYSILTGQTVNRKSVIDEFQSDPSKSIFLISLKAGGVGLNLTAADYIFIIDPWWNPAAEMQAISRAHRIGQDKKVFVYRFISENTVEEKIQKLQNKKSAIADEFINSNDPFRGWTKSEIIQLFE